MVRKSKNKQAMAKISRDKLAACMTCPLCNHILRDATTVSECLHTFCKKCIHEKITNEDLNSCPVCNTSLGCAPLDKLRSDHNLQDLRDKIFPPKREKEKANIALEEVAPSASILPTTKNEISLSSLVITTPKVATTSSVRTGKRAKSAPRRFLAAPQPIFPANESHNKADEPEARLTITNYNKESFATGESSKQMSRKDTDIWKPLTSLVDAATETSNVLDSQGTIVANPTSSNACYTNQEPASRAKIVKKRGNRSNVRREGKDSTPTPSGSAKPRGQKCAQQQIVGTSGGLNLNVPAQMEDANNGNNQRCKSFWFTLVASKDQTGEAPLPQIPSRYLRVKDANLPVSYIQKYIVKKLGLASESEVEILLQGQPVAPTLQLHNLIDMWLQTLPPSYRIQALLGSSGEDFLMVISYARKA